MGVSLKCEAVAQLPEPERVPIRTPHSRTGTGSCPTSVVQHHAGLTQEREPSVLPPLKALVENLDAYETIFLGFPILGGSAPPIVRSSLGKQDFAGRTIVPFNLHGGYGLGDSARSLRRQRRGRGLPKALLWKAYRKRRTTLQVREWLTQAGMKAE